MGICHVKIPEDHVIVLVLVVLMFFIAPGLRLSHACTIT